MSNRMPAVWTDVHGRRRRRPPARPDPSAPCGGRARRWPPPATPGPRRLGPTRPSQPHVEAELEDVPVEDLVVLSSMRTLPASLAFAQEPYPSSSSQRMHSALMKPRWKSVWITPAHSRAGPEGPPARTCRPWQEGAPAEQGVGGVHQAGQRPSPMPRASSSSAGPPAGGRPRPPAARRWAAPRPAWPRTRTPPPRARRRRHPSTSSSPMLTTTRTGLLVRRKKGLSASRCSAETDER